MCLQRKLNKGGKKDEAENGSLRGKKSSETRQSEQRDSAIGFNDFIFTFGTGGEEKNQKKESYVNFRSWEITSGLCVWLRM